MDQEVYDTAMAALADHSDPRAAEEVAMVLAFHYPETGRALLVALGSLPAT